MFETPTLSTHTKDGDDDVGRPTGGKNDRFCSSCGSGNVSGTGRTQRQKGRKGLSPSFALAGPSDMFGAPTAAAAAAAATATAAGKRQARRAASLLYSSLRFASAVKSETLPPGEYQRRWNRGGVYSWHAWP